MGISGLHSFLIKKNAIIYRKKLNYNYIAIDAMYIIYKFLYSDSQEVLFNILNQILKFLKDGITPIYIIDGKPPDIKLETIEKRKNKKIKIISELQNLNKYIENNQNNIEFINKLAKLKKKSLYLTPQLIEDFKNLLDILQIQYIIAEGEADYLCCKLCKEGIVSACLTGDMDFLLLGCNIIINFQSKKKNKYTIIEYNLKYILKILKLTQKQFLQFCLLLDNDYFQYRNKPNINVIYEKIQLYKSIENWIDNEHDCNIKKYLIKSLQNYELIHDLYSNTNINCTIKSYKNYISIVKLTHFFDNHIKKTSFKYHRSSKIKKLIRNVNIKNNNKNKNV